jgi:uncharacterized alpha-E superfamily protein
LERADTIARVLNVSAELAIQKGDEIQTFQEILGTAAAARGIVIEDESDVARTLLKDHSTSSIYHSLYTAHSNATQVGSVELIQAISEIVSALEEAIPGMDTPRSIQGLMESVLGGLSNVYQIIDDSWFHREPLSEEEVYHRFIQQ